ncbi:hypothetical protein RCG19_22450 [Neobacillus sp. OS1-2]|uniref:hypothetical protein n=1 Tax=Neobacillus sp. OS1-2 TaxID=3070680 RepID=UPI0027DF548B|nr:hypothetical protein [Neobacillus sp. OS1-2]WML39892.1 hypothetical protein RCG19_22450 [Neobacillus sp. OS1-2]
MQKKHYPISIFILDVRNSSANNVGDELTVYLDEIVKGITIWTKDVDSTQIRHRAGDEIIFVGYGYSTAYILAFFLSRIWKYRGHQPYFGLAFGDIDRSLEEIDIEKWIHPLIKQARYANDLLKQESNRPLFKFELDQFYQSPFAYNQFRNEFESLLNTILHLQYSLIKEQTKIQEQVCSTYLIVQQQKAVGTLLGKTPPTISSHYKKGKSEEILGSFHEIITILNSLQEKAYKNTWSKGEILVHSIRNHLKENIKTVLDHKD